MQNKTIHMEHKINRQSQRLIRKKRVRAKLSGSATRPRLALYRSNKGFFAQVIDDEKALTLIGIRSDKSNREAAKKLASDIVKAALAKKISAMVFDRSGYRYHGVFSVFADEVRQGGITI